MEQSLFWEANTPSTSQASSCHHDTDSPQVADGGKASRYVQQLRTADKG
jgi:hypothetical protein